MESALRKLQDRIQQNFHLKKIGGGSKFFGGARRGEGVELSMDLNSTDKDRQKNAVKRIIANMTLGRDVSQLFVEVVKLGQTLNVELKKLVYLYVLNTAKLQPEKALMAVNTFLQDAAHASPVIRALAVRTMMCIRVECVMEYTLEPLRRSVTDVDPYVRKTAAMGLGKLYHQNAKVFTEQNFMQELVRLLSDPFPVVSSNACAVLAEICAVGTAAVEIRSEWVNQLLNALPECSEWGQGYIMDLLALYNPATAEAADTLLARVVPRLAHTNPAVVMGTIKVIVTQASRCSVDVNSVYVPRVNAALLTLAKAEPETQFVVCKNVHMLLVLLPTLLQNHVDCFYIRFSDPSYVKMEKLKLILRLTTPSNAEIVIKELAEYVTEVDLAFVREVVATIAAVAIKVDAVAPKCTQMLLEVVSKRPELITQVITASKNIVRKYPELLLLDALLRDHGAESVVEEEAKVSLVWMLGEFCDFVEGGTAVLQEYFIANLLSQEQSVQLAVLTAVIKVFLRNPSGMEATLNHVLEQLTTQCVDPDVRDRAFAYWRLLSKGVGVEQMKKIVHGRKPPVDVYRSFSDAVTVGDMRTALNTAAAVYGRPARSFLQVYGAVDTANADSDEDDELLEMDVEPATAAGSTAATGSSIPPTAAPAPAVVKRVDPLEDIFRGPAATPTTPAQQNPATTGAPPSTNNTLGELFDGHTSSSTSVTTAAGRPVFRADVSTAADVLFGTSSSTPSTLVSSSAVVPSPSAPPVMLTAAETGGIVYRASVSVTHPVPKLTIIIENLSATTVRDFMLQINTNSYGLVPSLPIAECLKPNPQASPSQFLTADIPLRVLDSHFFATRHVLEVAIKSNLGLHRFSVTLPAECMMHVPAPSLDRTGFLHQWKSIEETCEGKMMIPTAASRMLLVGAAAVKARLEQCHAVVVADRGTDDQLSVYGGCRTHMGLTALFEIILKKSAPNQSYVCCRSMRVNDVMPAVVNLLEAAFSPSAGSTTPAATAVPAVSKAPAMVRVEDLFS